ncbi:MAG: M48 family metallopeptidase [Anaeromyxobacter sp.]
MANPDRAAMIRSFVKALVLPALTLLLVPLGAIAFTRYGEAKLDGQLRAAMTAQIERSAKLSPDEKVEWKAFVAAHPPSAACTDAAPDAQRYRAMVCEPWGEVWQFAMADRVALASAVVGVLALLGVGVLGLVAFRSRAAQYWSFMLGWRALVAVTVLETIAQGALLVWLSYWVTALLFERYVPKLIFVAAIAAAGAAYAIVKAVLTRPPEPEPLEAEALREEDAPGLWARVRELASRVGTAPPATIAAGIDDNFFVTEYPLALAGGAAPGGRLLYVSLPLLRTLAPAEAAAVLGHELAHFKGGDTAASARLQPALARYHAYTGSLEGKGLTGPAAAVMRLYRAIFELALSREQRRRELVADAEAARVTSPADVGRALVKVVSYSSFRARTERELFEQQVAHEGGLSLRGRIDAGLAAHAAAPGFVEHVRGARVPHPFDSHPPLDDRLAAVKAGTRLEDAAAILAERPERTWADEVETAEAIEERLWGAYEGRFQAVHEESLAWRYLPATEAERAHVVKYFPDRAFPTKDGGEVRITHEGVVRADGQRIRFVEIAAAKVDAGTFTEGLVLTRAEGAPGEKTFKVKLKPLGKGADAFKAAFQHYWQRDQVARQHAAGAAA